MRTYTPMHAVHTGSLRNIAFLGLAFGIAAVLGAACATAPAKPAQQHAAPSSAGQYPFVGADVEFMSGMIPHHAQAVVMANWCESHGARKDLAVLCGRIVVGQADEIELMRTWLRDRGQEVPDAKSTRHKMKMGDMVHDMLMPGMLTDEEMAALDKARGQEFDRLFLTGMIQHHQGAIDMVDVLFKSYGAAQDETVFKFATDVYADQTTEIRVMYKMLEGGNPMRSQQ